MKTITQETYPLNWGESFRIGVFNNPILDNITITTTTVDNETIETITDTTDYDNLTITEIYENADYWSTNTAGHNTYNNVECEFTYNKNYPLYIIITGDYTETTTYDYDMGTITYNEPCIIEKTVYKERLSNGNYPIPIMDLIDYEENDGISTITLQAYQESNPVILYNLPLDQDYGTGTQYAIRGVQINGNIDQTDNLIVYAKLRAPNGMVGQRSIVLQDADYTIDSINTLNIGGLGDLWGFNTLDMTQLEDWELELSTTNLLNNDESTLQISDITITFYIEKIEKQTISVSVEGENLAYYGAFIDTVEIPEGLETDTSFLTIDGTDTNDAYRQNIREKTITLNFNVDSCDLETSAMMLRQVTKLLVNDKDEYNRPIPKIIEFSHYPNSYFEYIIESTLEIETEITGYNVTAKLTIPSGTSYSQENTVTNNIGYVQGLAAINPIITVQPNDEVIQITETVTGQNFNIGYTGNWNNKVVEIDCEDRKVWLLTDEDADDGIDISKYVDMNSDWFRLHGEYQFEATNATIRTITYNERW